jgi:hypothetical protein
MEKVTDLLSKFCGLRETLVNADVDISNEENWTTTMARPSAS